MATIPTANQNEDVVMRVLSSSELVPLDKLDMTPRNLRELKKLADKLGLKPKRKETSLISGQVWVDPRSFTVRRIEGEVAKTPSWWLKKIYVKITFADLGGIWLPTKMEAAADVRVFGPHILTSHVLDCRSTSEVALIGPRRSSSSKP